jgi:hypothetical protein
VPAAQVVEWHEPDGILPDVGLIEIGRLYELWIIPIGGRAMDIARIPPAEVDKCHLVFDPRPGYGQRIHLLTTPVVRRSCIPGWSAKTARPLAQYAAEIGGYQAQVGRYPALQVSPLGRLAKVSYQCAKGNFDTGKDDEGADGFSIYVHQMGEEGGIRPGIAVDKLGRLWLAGGSYRCLRAGITN